MASSEASVFGLAKQNYISTHGSFTAPLDSAFTYLLFTRGSYAPQNIILPLDKEVGGGALLRSVQKVGVTSGGSFQLIPRPQSLGWLLYGVTGAAPATTDNLDGSYSHVFTLGADQFAAPYFSTRMAPGNLWGEEFRDGRLNAFTLEWRAPDFYRSTIGFVGRTPAKVSTAGWTPATYLDDGPQFITPLGTVELPGASAVKVLSGQFVSAMAIPLDEQFVVGSYEPEDLDIVTRGYMLNMTLRIDSDTLYTKMMYDPAGGSAWVAEIFKNGDFVFSLETPDEIAAGVPHSLTIAGNGLTPQATANVAWSAQPIGIQTGRIVTMNVTGTFLASTTADPSIELTLVNDKAAYT